MNAKAVWIVALLAQLLLLGFLVAREERLLRRGVPVLLEVRPVDPMDLFSGRYVSVPLAISRVDLDLTIHPTPWPDQGETVYARLERRSAGLHEVAEISRSRPSHATQVWARAQVLTKFDPDHPHEILELEFGADRYYIPETGVDPSFAERADGTRRRITVAARIASDGRIAIEDMLVDGEPYADWSARQPR